MRKRSLRCDMSVSYTHLDVYKRQLTATLCSLWSLPLRRKPQTRGPASLIKDVAADPIPVSYAWTRDVEHNADVKIMRVSCHD